MSWLRNSCIQNATFPWRYLYLNITCDKRITYHTRIIQSTKELSICSTSLLFIWTKVKKLNSDFRYQIPTEHTQTQLQSFPAFKLPLCHSSTSLHLQVTRTKLLSHYTPHVSVLPSCRKHFASYFNGINLLILFHISFPVIFHVRTFFFFFNSVYRVAMYSFTAAVWGVEGGANYSWYWLKTIE
jgi:hypothetical protein